MDITAPMLATVWKIVVQQGATVARGDRVIILESMKTEFPLEAPCDGVNARINVAEGDTVDHGSLLAVVEKA